MVFQDPIDLAVEPGLIQGREPARRGIKTHYPQDGFKDSEVKARRGLRLLRARRVPKKFPTRRSEQFATEFFGANRQARR